MTVMLELQLDAITDESVARAVLVMLDDLPGFEPQQYDLNQRGQFRAWELDRAVVDLLTQRTQLFTIQGTGGQALIATGKHGEPPTVAVMGEAASGLEAARWEALPCGVIART